MFKVLFWILVTVGFSCGILYFLGIMFIGIRILVCSCMFSLNKWKYVIDMFIYW